MHTYSIRPRKDKRGVDLISDALPFGRLWYGEPNAKFYSRSHNEKYWGTIMKELRWFFVVSVIMQILTGCNKCLSETTARVGCEAPAAQIRKAITRTSTAEEFRRLMDTVAEGWNEGNARKAAECYTEDAVYTEPPDKQVYVGRKALYEFFGGGKKAEPPMKMVWHHLAFDEEGQIGFGEYTFQMNNRYHA
jgi:ketosteroid isomerase-like protein